MTQTTSGDGSRGRSRPHIALTEVGGSAPPLAAAVMDVLGGTEVEHAASAHGVAEADLRDAAARFVEAGTRALRQESSRVDEAAGGKRQQILALAADLFARRGYHAASLDEISNSLGITRPALYYYFSSKADLLAAVVREGLRDRESALKRDLTNDDVAGALYERLAEKVLALLGSRLPYYKVFLAEREHVSAELADEIRATEQSEVRHLAEILRTGMENGSIRPVPPVLTASALLGMVNVSARWYNPDGAPVEEVASLLADLAVSAVTNPNRSPRSPERTLNP